MTCSQCNITFCIHIICRNILSGRTGNRSRFRGNGAMQRNISLCSIICGGCLNPDIVFCRYLFIIGNISICRNLADRIFRLQCSFYKNIPLLVKRNIAGVAVLVLLHRNIGVNR